MSNMVDHARRELEIIGENPETTEGYLKVVQAFDDMGHLGGSAMVAVSVITMLLCQKNLSPITDWPDDWILHRGSDFGPGVMDIWQSKRNYEAFSLDGGKTHYVLGGGDVIVTVKSEHDKRHEVFE